MRARLILENAGHTITKHVELAKVPAVGGYLMADCYRCVERVEYVADRGEVDVYLREDIIKDSAYRHIPWVYLLRLDILTRNGWEIEGEATLRARLKDELSRQDDDEPVGQD
ncbi:hypothetical protein [Sorangium sp. So ce204]|uniref:hypothetical protein n=1 Tax=Sorangium sp. So ce204 TaxID=3133288 RepID=UPI003F5E9C9B